MLLALGLLSAAYADDLRGLLGQAKTALAAGEYKDARDLLVRAEAAAPLEEGRVTTADLARIFFYRGVVFWRASPESAALEAWRQALTLDPTFQPDPTLLSHTDERDVFLALRDEVGARPEVGLRVPSDPGEAVIYVDGRAVAEGDTAFEGLHFVQIRCEDGSYEATWYEFGAPPTDYLVLCEGGTYRGAKSPAPTAASRTASSSAAASGASAGVDRDAKAAQGFGGKDIAGVSLLVLGAAGAGGTLYLYDQAAQSAAAYDKKVDAPAVDDAEADAYYDETVTPRFLRMYAAGAATGLFLAGGVVLVVVGSDGPALTPLPGGGVLTWSGRF